MAPRIRTQNTKQSEIKHGALVISSGSTQLEEALYVLHLTQKNLGKLYILHENKVLFSKYSTDFVFYSEKKKQSDKIDLRSAVLYLILSGADIADLDLKIKSSSTNFVVVLKHLPKTQHPRAEWLYFSVRSFLSPVSLNIGSGFLALLRSPC